MLNFLKQVFASGPLTRPLNEGERSELKEILSALSESKKHQSSEQFEITCRAAAGYLVGRVS